MAVFKACCDETGTHNAAPVTCVGGYVFDEKGEQAFTERWDAILQPMRVRGIRYFHAADCDALAGKFVAINRTESNAFFGDLIELIRDTAKFGFVTAVGDDTFRQAQRNKIQNYTGTKYTACILRSLKNLGPWSDRHQHHSGFVYAFESGCESQDEAEHIMNQIRENDELRQRYSYEDHAFLPKESLLPLQAADLFIWIWQKILLGVTVKDNRDPAYARARAYLGNLLRSPKPVPHYRAHISTLSLFIDASINMADGVKSNRTYEEQTGDIRTYDV